MEFLMDDDTYHDDTRTCRWDITDNDSDEECQHELITNGYCNFCGLMMQECLLLTDEIITDPDKGTRKKEYTNEILVNMIGHLDIPKNVKKILLDYVTKNPSKIRGNIETIKKVLCYYSYILILAPMMVECSFFRFFEFCGMNKRNIKKIIEHIKNIKGLTNVYNISYIHPITLIKEFLYVMNLRIDNSLENVPIKYTVPIGHKDIIMFASYLFTRNQERKREYKNKLIKYSQTGDETELDEFIEDEYLNEKERKEMHINRYNIFSKDMSESEFDEKIAKMCPDEYLTDNPHRLAACILSNILLFSISDLDEVEKDNTILKKKMSKVAGRIYTQQDIIKYFSISASALNTLISKYGIRIKNNRSKKIAKDVHSEMFHTDSIHEK